MEEKLSYFADVILTNDMMFCGLECLCMKYSEVPELFQENEIEMRNPEGQEFRCNYCGKEREEE